VTGASSGRAPAGVAATRVSGLQTLAGTDHILVRFESEPAGVFTVSASPPPAATGGAPAVAASGEPRTAHELRVTGLVPGTLYRLAIRDGSGRIAAQPAVATLSVVQAARTLRQALDALRPLALARELLAAAQPILQVVRRTPDSQRQHDAHRRRWEQKLKDAYRRSLLVETVERIQPVRDALFSSGEVSPKLKSALYERLDDLLELEEAAGPDSIPVPAVASRLASPEYGPVDQHKVEDRPGVRLVLDVKDTGPKLRAAKSIAIVDSGTEPGKDMLKSLVDPRIAAVRERSWLDFARPFIILGPAVTVPSGPPRGPPAPLEVVALLEDPEDRRPGDREHPECHDAHRDGRDAGDAGLHAAGGVPAVGRCQSRG
jgi:hypothetical protein